MANQPDEHMVEADIINKTLEFVRSLAPECNAQLTVLTIALAIACYEWEVTDENAVENFEKALDDVTTEMASAPRLN